jgi:hypothetical protein
MLETHRILERLAVTRKLGLDRFFPPGLFFLIGVGVIQVVRVGVIELVRV